LDELGCIASQLATRRDDGGERLADVAHAANRERVVLDARARRHRQLEERVGQNRNLVSGQGAVDAAHLERLGQIDRLDLRVRVRRAHEVDISHTVPLDVVEEDALPLDEALVLLARDARADESRLRLGRFDNKRLGDLGHSATALIASTMFTYPVQRQMFPWIALRISSSLGLGFCSSRYFALISIPGVQ